MRLVKVATLLVFAALTPCVAAVIYSLDGTGGSPPIPLDFQLTTPSFILSNTTVLAAGLDSCTSSCTQVSFAPISPHDNGFSHIEFFTPSTSFLFFFDLGSFAAPGTYNTVFGAGTGTLTVTQTAAVVPEPATIALTLGGLAGLFAMRRYRK